MKAVDRTAFTCGHAASALMTVVESVRTLPTNRAVFEHAKIIYVMERVCREVCV